MKQASNAMYRGPRDIRFLRVPDDMRFTPTDNTDPDNPIYFGPGGPCPERMRKRK